MQHYLIIPAGHAKAQQITRVLYELRRPSPDADDVTRYWIGIIDHTDGRAALIFPAGSGRARIDPNCIPQNFIDLVKSYLTVAEQQAAKQAIIDAQGSRVLLTDIIPQRILDKLQTEAQMEADGWPVGANVAL